MLTEGGQGALIMAGLTGSHVDQAVAPAQRFVEAIEDSESCRGPAPSATAAALLSLTTGDPVRLSI